MRQCADRCEQAAKHYRRRRAVAGLVRRRSGRRARNEWVPRCPAASALAHVRPVHPHRGGGRRGGPPVPHHRRGADRVVLGPVRPPRRGVVGAVVRPPRRRLRRGVHRRVSRPLRRDPASVGNGHRSGRRVGSRRTAANLVPGIRHPCGRNLGGLHRAVVDRARVRHHRGGWFIRHGRGASLAWSWRCARHCGHRRRLRRRLSRSARGRVLPRGTSPRLAVAAGSVVRHHRRRGGSPRVGVAPGRTRDLPGARRVEVGDARAVAPRPAACGGGCACVPCVPRSASRRSTWPTDFGSRGGPSWVSSRWSPAPLSRRSRPPRETAWKRCAARPSERPSPSRSR